MWSIDSLRPPIFAAEALGFGEAWGQISQPLHVPCVGVVKAGGGDLRAGRAVEDLGGGGLDLVVEIAEHHQRCLVVAGQQVGGSGAEGDGFGGSAIQRVGAESGALALVVGAESVGEKGQ